MDVEGPGRHRPEAELFEKMMLPPGFSTVIKAAGWARAWPPQTRGLGPGRCEASGEATVGPQARQSRTGCVPS